MTTHNFSIMELAMSLIVRLDRNTIFPPMLNNPESFLTASDNLNNLSFRKQKKKRSPNAFLICRRNVHEESIRKGNFNMRIVSKVTGILWNSASPEEKDIYKKLADRVYEINYKRTSSFYKKAVSCKPHNSFPIHLQKTTPVASPPALPLTPQLEVSIDSILTSPNDNVSSSPTLSGFFSNASNIELENNGYFLNNLKNQSNNNDNNNNNSDFISISIIPHQDQLQTDCNYPLSYLYNNSFTSQH